VALIDFGEVGRLDIPLRETLLRLTMAISRQDSDRLVDELLALGATRRHLRRNLLKRDLDHVMRRYANRPIIEVSGANIFQQITNIAFHHHLQLPSELTLLFKVIVMDESLGAYLDPEFKLMEFARPYLKDFWHESISPESIARRIKEGSRDIADLGHDLPRQMKRILTQLQRGELTVTTHVEESRAVVKHLHRLANRISFSILLAGILISISTVIHAYKPGYGRRKDDRPKLP
jgi:ubiquinone biosynthesis protein